MAVRRRRLALQQEFILPNYRSEHLKFQHQSFNKNLMLKRLLLLLTVFASFALVTQLNAQCNGPMSVTITGSTDPS